MPSRPLFEGDTALNLRNAVLPEVEQAISAIEDLIGERINREGADLEIFLNRLWIMGRLELIYGGAEIHYAPNPSWLISQ